jgi:hypothetical protein
MLKMIDKVTLLSKNFFKTAFLSLLIFSSDPD